MRIFQQSPRVNGGNRFLFFGNFAPISSPGLLITGWKLYRPTKISTDISNDYPLTIDQVSAECRSSIGQLSAKCRRLVGEVSVNKKLYRPRHIGNDYLPRLDRVSTDYRPLYRPTIDRVSTAISIDISVDITYSKQDPVRSSCELSPPRRPPVPVPPVQVVCTQSMVPWILSWA